MDRGVKLRGLQQLRAGGGIWSQGPSSSEYHAGGSEELGEQEREWQPVEEQVEEQKEESSSSSWSNFLLSSPDMVGQGVLWDQAA